MKQLFLRYSAVYTKFGYYGEVPIREISRPTPAHCIDNGFVIKCVPKRNEEFAFGTRPVPFPNKKGSSGVISKSPLHVLNYPARVADTRPPLGGLTPWRPKVWRTSRFSAVLRSRAFDSRIEGHTLPSAGRLSPSRRRILCCSLLRGAGVLRCGALPAVCAEDSHFHASILLPVVSGLFVVHRLVFAESHDLNAVHGYVVLRYQIRLHGFGAPAAQLGVVFGRARLVPEAWKGHEGALPSSHLLASNLVDLLLRFVRYL